jgi:hypothetical protein
MSGHTPLSGEKATMRLVASQETMRWGDLETLRLGGAERIVLGVFCLFSLVALGLCAGATLSWNANKEPDVAGYRIYWSGARRLPCWILLRL